MNGLIIALIVILCWLGLVLLMLRGWRRRGRRQTDKVGEFPVVPEDAGERRLGPDSGLYVGSTFAPSWTDRLAVGDYGDRASCSISMFAQGILIERQGANSIWIPAASVTAIRTERGLAGKVMTRDGLLVIRWRLPSGTEIDSGVRCDDKSCYPRWVAHDPNQGD